MDRRRGMCYHRAKHYYFYHLGDLNIISFSIPDSTSRNLNASDSENSREVLWKAETDRSENLLHSKYKGGSMGKTDIVTKNYMRGSDIFADAFNIIYSKNSPSSTGGR